MAEEGSLRFCISATQMRSATILAVAWRGGGSGVVEWVVMGVEGVDGVVVIVVVVV